MACAIKWTKRADKDLYQMVEYAEVNWSNQAFHAFIESVFASLDLIATFPELGLSENKRKHLLQLPHSQTLSCFLSSSKKPNFLIGFC